MPNKLSVERNVAGIMSTTKSSIDLRSELAELVKRKAEIAVSCIVKVERQWFTFFVHWFCLQFFLLFWTMLTIEFESFMI